MATANQAHSSIRDALRAHREEIQPRHLRELFAQHDNRFAALSLEIPGLLLDISRQRITVQTLTLLSSLAQSCQLQRWIEQLFAGDNVNNTENRPALHTLLRHQAGTPLASGLQAKFDRVVAVREQVAAFADAVRNGQWRGIARKPITDVINIGIGGSHLGSKMAVEALASRTDNGPHVHFLANLDPAHVANLLNSLDPTTTLVIVVSKTFNTKETLTNAQAVRQWWLDTTGETTACDKHFVAVTANPGKAVDFGIARANVFEFWDWVGGRYSLWSAVGLAIAIRIGAAAYHELLAGAHQMDRHFSETPFAQNMPVVLGLLDVWNTNYLEFTSRAVVPYRDSLRSLPAYLQQLEMESNGKSVQRDGTTVGQRTQAVVWGNVGTDSQHAFFQLLHQGTRIVPVDFIVALSGDSGYPHQHDMLVASCLAQAEALARGRTRAETAQQLTQQHDDAALLDHQVFAGNRPSTVLALDQFDAYTLGMLLALYEHKVFVSSCIWNINPFDQMGVELGKTLADSILDGMSNDNESGDLATNALISRYQRLKRG